MATVFALTAAHASASDALAPGATLCMHELRVPLAEESGAARRLAIEQKLVTALRAAAFEVPEPSAVEASFDRVMGEFGPVIDLATGERIPERYAARNARWADVMTKEFGCDAFVLASVVVVRASFSGGTAAWDGTRQSVSSTGRQVLNVLGGVHESGWVNALSLWIRVLDFEENELAFRSAGIETPVGLAVLRDEDLVPEDHWLTDPARIDAAILSALGSDGNLLRNHGTPGRTAPSDP